MVGPMFESTDLGYIAKYSRVLFRKTTWLKVGALLSCQQTRDGITRNDTVLKDADGLSALQRSNWNSVVSTKTLIDSATKMEKPMGLSPFVVVMLSMDLSTKQQTMNTWSDDFVNKCVRNGRIYGEIGANTHVVVQIVFKNVASSSLPITSTPHPKANAKMNLKSTSKGTWGADTGTGCDTTNLKDVVCVVMVDSAGIAYSYNIPSGHCQELVFRCVSRLMQVALKTTPSMMIQVVGYDARSIYDDYMYAIFLTSSCASETAAIKILNHDSLSNASTFGRSYARPLKKKEDVCDLGVCKPSGSSARPTRVIANLRFLMLLTRPCSGGIVEELLLDERNNFDVFRRIVMEITI